LNRKKLPPVENSVFITVIAVICNAQGWEEIADFGNSRRGFFPNTWRCQMAYLLTMPSIVFFNF